MKEIIGCRATVPEIIGRIDAVMDRIEMHLRLGRRIFILIPRPPSETAAGSGKTLPPLIPACRYRLDGNQWSPKPQTLWGTKAGENAAGEVMRTAQNKSPDKRAGER